MWKHDSTLFAQLVLVSFVNKCLDTDAKAFQGKSTNADKSQFILKNFEVEIPRDFLDH